MMYYVYMMANKYNNVLYTGFTNNLIRRIFVHKEHMAPESFTARYRVEKLVYYEREEQIKSWNRKRKNELVESVNPQRRNLYSEIID